MANTHAPESRRLNMEEKRRLEELLLTEIDAASRAYGNKREKERSTFFARLAQAKAIQSRFKRYIAAQAEMKRMSKVLNKLGFGTDRYGESKLYVIVPSEIGAVQAFDAQTAKVTGALTDMKRAYILKLFAGGEEAQTLLASLSAELKALTK